MIYINSFGDLPYSYWGVRLLILSCSFSLFIYKIARTMNRKMLLTALLSWPLIAMAHDGHGAFQGHQIEHYVISPGHAVPLILVTVAFLLLIAYRQWKRAAQKNR